MDVELARLPDELLILILAWLSPWDIASLSSVSRGWCVLHNTNPMADGAGLGPRALAWLSPLIPDAEAPSTLGPLWGEQRLGEPRQGR